jgi:hypothetical protein
MSSCLFHFYVSYLQTHAGALYPWSRETLHSSDAEDKCLVNFGLPLFSIEQYWILFGRSMLLECLCAGRTDPETPGACCQIWHSCLSAAKAECESCLIAASAWIATVVVFVVVVRHYVSMMFSSFSLVFPCGMLVLSRWLSWQPWVSPDWRRRRSISICWTLCLRIQLIINLNFIFKYILFYKCNKLLDWIN